MSSTEKVDRIQVCFQISYEKWQLLQANWSDGEMTESELLNAVIDRYLDLNIQDILRTSSQVSQLQETSKIERRDRKSRDFDPSHPLHQYINERVGEIVEKNLDSYLDRHLHGRIETILRDEISRQVDRKGDRSFNESGILKTGNSKGQSEVAISPSKGRSSRHATELKTAKELALILGCSPSYITTLNRIGELVKRGWKDSGKRNGKRILYQPVESE